MKDETRDAGAGSFHFSCRERFGIHVYAELGMLGQTRPDPALSVKRTLADSGPLVAYVGCCCQTAHSAVLQGV